MVNGVGKGHVVSVAQKNTWGGFRECSVFVSTLSRGLVIRRIDTTTLYHVTAVMVSCETSIIAEQDAVIFVT